MRTHPFFKGPALADFMLIVVEHFLPSLDHLVAHVLNLRHSLHRTQDTANINPLVYYEDKLVSHSRLYVHTACPAAKDLHHHKLASDKKPVEGGARMYAPCISACGQPWRWCWGHSATVDPDPVIAESLTGYQLESPRHSLAWLLTERHLFKPTQICLFLSMEENARAS